VLVLLTSAWVVLLLVLPPPHPGRRMPGPAAAAAGLAAGVLVSATVLRREQVGRRARELAARTLRLPKAKVAFLGLAAVNEELLWRRLVLDGILPAGALAALAVSTLGFALAHRARPALHLGTGATFGGLYLATGALAAPVAAHWAYNTLLLAGFGRDAPPPATGTGTRSSEGGLPALAGLQEVTKRFGRSVALDRVSFGVGSAEVVAVLGPNGAGKSTAISILLGLRRPDGGSARVFGADPRTASARRLVGAAPQETAFPATLRVREVVDLVRAHYAEPLPAQTLYDRFGLGRLVARRLGGLSVGERRRVGVALAFAGNPRLVVLDEPTAGLDRESRLAVWEAVRVHVQQGGAVLLTTHHLEEADALADRLVLLEHGRVVAGGPVAQLKAAAGLTVVRFRAPPGTDIEGAEQEGPYVRIFTRDGGAMVERLVRRGVRLAELEVRTLTLEEALSVRSRA
jgi:ABC-2 type transport system ATP-binding protein